VRSSNAGRAQTGDRATDAATMTMLNLGIEAWQENRTEERKAFRRMQVTAGGWWGHKRAEAQHDLVLAGLRASRVLLRETVRLMGAHLRRAGLRPEDLVPALHDVLQRASSKAHVADGPDLVELVRDAVTWGIEGYYAIGNR
jgi:hypothetical protein